MFITQRVPKINTAQEVLLLFRGAKLPFTPLPHPTTPPIDADRVEKRKKKKEKKICRTLVHIFYTAQESVETEN